MSRLQARLPTRSQSRRMFSSLSILLFALLAIVTLTPTVSAEDAKSEYGTVIGIGTWHFFRTPYLCLIGLLA